MKLAEALISTNNKNNLESIIKEGWIKAEMSTSELRYFRSKFKSFLSSDDYINRAEYLAWEKNIGI